MSTQTCPIERVYILNHDASLTTLNDAYNERFEKLAALMHVSLCDDFNDYPEETTYHYRSIISDVMDELKELQREIMQKNDKEALKKLVK